MKMVVCIVDHVHIAHLNALLVRRLDVLNKPKKLGLCAKGHFDNACHRRGVPTPPDDATGWFLERPGRSRMSSSQALRVLTERVYIRTSIPITGRVGLLRYASQTFRGECYSVLGRNYSVARSDNPVTPHHYKDRHGC